MDCVTRKKLGNWRIWGALLGVDFMIWLGVNQCFAPLPCTVYLVYTSTTTVIRPSKTIKFAAFLGSGAFQTAKNQSNRVQNCYKSLK